MVLTCKEAGAGTQAAGCLLISPASIQPFIAKARSRTKLLNTEKCASKAEHSTNDDAHVRNDLAAHANNPKGSCTRAMEPTTHNTPQCAQHKVLEALVVVLRRN